MKGPEMEPQNLQMGTWRTNFPILCDYLNCVAVWAWRGSRALFLGGDWKKKVLHKISEGMNIWELMNDFCRRKFYSPSPRSARQGILSQAEGRKANAHNRIAGIFWEDWYQSGVGFWKLYGRMRGGPGSWQGHAPRGRYAKRRADRSQ